MLILLCRSPSCCYIHHSMVHNAGKPELLIMPIVLPCATTPPLTFTRLIYQYFHGQIHWHVPAFRVRNVNLYLSSPPPQSLQDACRYTLPGTDWLVNLSFSKNRTSTYTKSSIICIILSAFVYGIWIWVALLYIPRGCVYWLIHCLCVDVNVNRITLNSATLKYLGIRLATGSFQESNC